MRAPPPAIDGVLFDLDGTLLDSAPDLHAALVAYADEAGVAAPPLERVRPVVSSGAMAVLRCAFDEDEAALARRLPRFLELYGQRIAQDTRPFAGVPELLQQLETRALPWGIVTNKAGALTCALLERIGWRPRLAALVCGDTLPVKKPDPAPVRLACSQAGIEPSRGVFVGDDRRDVLAGKAAGLYTVAVGWGYLNGGDPMAWGADCLVERPQDLAALLGLHRAA
ncbi:MAG: HAD-IA family hydrolase [Fulvimonas sp.]|nr:HAD-IA family hydrolase [Fulvimonas sp.]